MSYLPQFENDLFISYAQVDNLPLRAEEGWITQFQRALEVKISQLLGFAPKIWRDPNLPFVKELGIWRDPKPAGKDEFALTTLAALHGAAILVCVLSRGYLRSERCLWELQEYVSSHKFDDNLPSGERTKNRHIFKIVVSPIAFDEQPPDLKQRLGYEFFETDPATGSIHQMTQAFGPQAQLNFWLRLDDLAQDIVVVLERLRERTAEEEKVKPPPTLETGTFKIFEMGGQGRALRVFLCHSSNDKPKVRALYQLLVRIGVDAWLDEEKLVPGQFWEIEIPKAVRSSDAVLVCLSRESLTKTGYVQKEIKQALDVADEHPEDAIFLIPAKFEDCAVPERLSKRHWVNLFEERGTQSLVRALEARTTQLNVKARVGN